MRTEGRYIKGGLEVRLDVKLEVRVWNVKGILETGFDK